MDKDGLIPIGGFAKLTDLSPRFLRKLDDRGLLSPVSVDPDSRYRYYSVHQTRLAGLIHLGRQMGLTVDQLGDLVEAYDADELHPYLERQRTAVAARLAEQARLLRLLDQELGRGGRPLAYRISLKETPELLVMSGAGSLRRTHPHDSWALESALRKVGANVKLHIARQGEEPARHPVILYDTDLARDEDITFEVCFPVARELPEAGGVKGKSLPAARVAFTTFRGPYDTIWNAYVELLAWVVDCGFEVTGPLRETGIVNDGDTDDPREWLTELAVPVADSRSA